MTPGHFLIGCPLTSPSEPHVLTIPQNRLRKFQLIQSRIQHFWRRWSSEYLHQLQHRGRWITKSKNLVGDLAILKHDNIPSICWKLVRIVKVCPGADNIVVTVRSADRAEYLRPVSKLARLPKPEEEDAEYTEN